MSRDADGIIKQKYAESGDVGLGGLDIEELWPISYSTPGGPFPQRIQFNQLFRYLSALGVELNSKGPFLDWDGTDPEGPDYEIGAGVKGSDSDFYICKIANGPASTIVDPVGDSTGTWVTASSIFGESGLSRGFLNGFILSNGTDSDHDINLTAGAIGLADGAGNFKLFSDDTPPVKQIDANWVEGNNQGGFPSGLTLSASTIYDYYIIGKDDGTLDAGWDTEGSNAANLLADATDYTWYRRRLSIKTDGSSNIVAFKHHDNDFVEYLSSLTDVFDSTLTNDTYETGTISVPKNQMAKMNILGAATGSTVIIITIADVGGNRVNDHKLSNGGAGAFQLGDLWIFHVDSNSQLKYKISTDVTLNSITIKTEGWFDCAKEVS